MRIIKRLSNLFFAVLAEMNVSAQKESCTSNINLSHWDYVNKKLSEINKRIVCSDCRKN